MNNPERPITSLIPYIEGQMGLVKPNNVDEFVEMLNKPIKEIGRALHTEFSGLNLRGVKTHDVEVRRSTSSMGARIEGGIVLDKDEMSVVSNLESSDFAEVGPTLKIFLNQLRITTDDITKGALILYRTNEDISKSDCGYAIVFLVKGDVLKQGKSGIMFQSFGNVSLVPQPKGLGTNNLEFKSELEKANHALLGELYNDNFENNPNILVARGIVEAALLVGKAIVNRRIKSDIF